MKKADPSVFQKSKLKETEAENFQQDLYKNFSLKVDNLDEIKLKIFNIQNTQKINHRTYRSNMKSISENARFPE